MMPNSKNLLDENYRSDVMRREIVLEFNIIHNLFKLIVFNWFLYESKGA